MPLLQTLMEVYNKLVKCDELLPVAANEVYFKTFRGRWCFLPGIPFLNCISCLGRPSWRLPQREMRDLATCMRRVARVLWAIHVTFQEVSKHLCVPLSTCVEPDAMCKGLKCDSPHLPVIFIVKR